MEKKVQLTSNILTNRIQDLLADTEKQTLSRLKSSFAFFVATCRINSNTRICKLLVSEQNIRAFIV
jgi:hypothetical protein